MAARNERLMLDTATHDIVAKLWNLCNVLKDSQGMVLG
jgi:hypothetical protein